VTSRGPVEGGMPFLSAGGVCGELVRSTDWTKTPLGAPESWPSSLKTTVGILLHSRHPMFLWWGEELVQIYNDGYLPSFGAGKHPAAMGQRGRDCWGEAWPIIGPQIDDVMKHGRASWHEDQLVPVFRNGRIEEVYWTYGYSAVYDDEGNIGGTLVVCTETTARVVAARRLGLVRALAVALLTAHDEADAIRIAATALGEAKPDIAFATLRDRGTDVPMMGHDDRDAARVELPLDAEQSIVFGLGDGLPFDDAYRGFLHGIVDQLVSTRARVRIESERRNLLQQAPVATAIMIGPDHVFEIANPLYCQMVGRDVLGKTYLEAFPELKDTPLPGILDRVYRMGEPFVTNEILVPLARAGGPLEDCFFKFNLEPIRNTEGKVYGMMAVATEITEQVTARRDLQAADRAKDEFLATMSHELRTPLNAMLGWATILKDPKSDAQKLAKGLEVIERNARTQARLVADLLDVSRIISGKLHLSTKRIEVTAAIWAAADVVRAAADAKGILLVVDVASDVGTATADPDRLQQIVWNLLTNAVRFTPRGGTVSLSASRHGSTVRIVVDDTGAGIAAGDIAHIFERFRQADATTTRSHGGLGLGLAIVRYLVEAHGGTVSATSRGPGHGASFTVTLPVRMDAPADAERALPPGEMASATTARGALHDVHVLVVDDDPDSLDLVREILERAGASFTGAKSSSEALEAAGPFDIVISDIGMPQIDGYALMRRMRERAAGATVPAIALTGFAHAGDTARALDAGYQEHLTKPLDGVALIDAVARWTRGRGGVA
jgi:signal transduction histidine kinase/ActR/RegA family two-component response regulator